MTAFHILFTSAGRRVSLIQHFRKSLKEMQLEGKIITADMKRNAAAALVADDHEIVPPVTDFSYISSLLKICKKHRIHLLIPLIDTELQILAEYRQSFEQIGTFVLVSSLEANDICYDKRKTAVFLESISMQTPKTLNPKQILSDPKADYPVMLKPYNGSGSKGVMKINNPEELKFFLQYIPNAMIQEYISGQEFTVDVLLDFQGIARAAVPRLRMETRAGEISIGMTVQDKNLMKAAKKVAEALPGAAGCITLQCFKTDDNRIVFIEINPRFGGGIPLTLAAGADYAKAIIQQLIGEQPDWLTMDDWQDGLEMLRYDEAFFVGRRILI